MTAAKEAYRSAMRADLVAAAERVVARTGLSGLTIRAILEEAGVAPGTLYSYFAGKEEILAAMGERLLDQYFAGLPESATSAEVFLGLLEQVFTSPPEGAEAIGELRARVAATDHGETARRVNESIVASTGDMVRRLLSPDVDGDAYAELLDIVWDGMIRRAATGTFVTDYERVGQLAFALLTGPLRGADPSTPRSRR